MPTEQECWNNFWVVAAHVHAANLRRRHARTTEITAALATLREPRTPVDGDCLRFEPRITDQLCQAGLPAHRLVIFGWVREKLLAFAHQATGCDGLVIDFTARQFNPEAPARWIVTEKEYRERLAEYTGVASVTTSQ